MNKSKLKRVAESLKHASLSHTEEELRDGRDLVTSRLISWEVSTVTFPMSSSHSFVQRETRSIQSDHHDRICTAPSRYLKVKLSQKNFVS